MRKLPTPQCLPFLKWAGGKRWFVERYLETLPRKYNCYYEPFLGSGALFFAMSPKLAVLSDANSDLIQAFSAVRNYWKPVYSLLRKYDRKHNTEFYYRLRETIPESEVARAARFIYLNRTCWNGLYRVNKRGQFNVPIGTKDRVLLATDDFRRASTLLKGATLRTADFEIIVGEARRGDLVFVDPPYVTAHSNNGFVKYNEKLFGWEDQLRLAASLIAAKARGAQILATNADTISVRRLYERCFNMRSVARTSVIAADSDNRGRTRELIVTSW